MTLYRCTVWHTETYCGYNDIEAANAQEAYDKLKAALEEDNSFITYDDFCNAEDPDFMRVENENDPTDTMEANPRDPDPDDTVKNAAVELFEALAAARELAQAGDHAAAIALLVGDVASAAIAKARGQ